ncbi:MAG: helix-turn-helix transcriptional regulator [Candidatus Riflebacteria bacterium]|nr:helix-turn-helix transcriptional regulator [Candidatus Riflebacteria bacterium]
MSSDNKSALKGLGKAIKAQRKLIKFSQTELANLAGVSLNLVSQVEAGKTTSQIGKVLDILDALGMRLNLEIGKGRITIQARKSF